MQQQTLQWVIKHLLQQLSRHHQDLQAQLYMPGEHSQATQEAFPVVIAESKYSNKKSVVCRMYTCNMNTIVQAKGVELETSVCNIRDHTANSAGLNPFINEHYLNP